MRRLKICFMVIFIFCSAGFFFYTVEQDRSVAPKTTVNSSMQKTLSSQNNAYYLKLSGSQIIVYRADDSVYEYTDLNKEILPSSVLEELKEGKYFQNEAELYEFLETYTS